MNSLKDLKFQIIDWHTENLEEKDDELMLSSSDEEDEPKYKLDESSYKIFVFGKDIDENTYSLMINDFTPYFYIKVPDNFSKIKVKILKNWVEEKMWFKHRNSFSRATLHKKMKFRGFTNKKKFKFVRLVFKNTNAMRNAIGLFQNKIWNNQTRKIEKITSKSVHIRGLTNGPHVYDLYENMIDPMIRFIHHRDLKPVGWINVKHGKWQKRSINNSHCHYNLQARWTDINFVKSEENVKIKVLAYDIECDSSHGDFPLPIKDYLKLSREIVYEYERMQKILHLKCEKINRTQKEKFVRYIKNKKKFVSECINSAFQNGNESINISKIYTIRDKKATEKTIDIVSHKIADLLIKFNPLVKTMERNKIRNNSIEQINIIMWDKNKPENSYFPEVQGDRTIQIGCSFIKYGENISYRNVMYTLGTCDPIKNTEVKCFKSEKNLLLAFRNLIIKEDPEIITGYNIQGFDTPWLMKRAIALNIESKFTRLSKFCDMECKLKIKQKKSAVGQLIKVDIVDIPGRIQLDIYNLVQKGYKLNSYKLDNVSANFIQGTVQNIERKNDKTYIYTDNIKGLNIGNFIIFIEKEGYLEDKYSEGKKFEIIDKNEKMLIINEIISLKLDTHKCSWCLGKDDVSPKDIFRLQKEGPGERYIIAKYCMMDVILCIELLLKLQFITNCIGMANVCLIPLNWSIHKGQGVKILSLVTNVLKKEGFLLPHLYRDLLDKDGYEGAVVLKPYPGIYLDDPISVLDYASLYPASMIMGNTSHETICYDDKWLGDQGIENLKNIGYGYHDVTYDTFKYIRTSSGTLKGKKKIGEKTVRFVQYPNDEKALIPKTLQTLLKARKDTRIKIKYKTVICNDGTEYIGLVNKDETKTYIKTSKGDKVEINNINVKSIKDTYTEFQKNIFDGLQLAFKITANSVYGQIGARVSDLYAKEIAASTTAIGRQQLEIAQTYCENPNNFKRTLENGTEIQLYNKIVYGDTDSVFVKFDCRYQDGTKMKGRDALAETIRLSKIAEEGIKKILMKPQDLEYEKTFWPFILFTKKRYVGNKYEFDLDKYKQTSMGIVTKRRDNAPICKVVFGGIIDIIMRTRQIGISIDFLRKTILSLTKGKFNLDTLIVSKTLSSYYKDPDRIAHKVLADRIAERDPGNKPQVNDRIPYVYVNVKENKKIKLLQGDKIEHPDYIKQHNLIPNYEYYITNQIMKPVCQIYGLCLEQIPGYRPNEDFELILKNLISQGKTERDAEKRVLEKKQKIAGKLLFGDILRTLENKRKGNVEITTWFSRKVSKPTKIFKKTTNKKNVNINLSDLDDDDSDDSDF